MHPKARFPIVFCALAFALLACFSQAIYFCWDSTKYCPPAPSAGGVLSSYGFSSPSPGGHVISRWGDPRECTANALAHDPTCTRTHEGVDITCSLGSPVLATASGTIFRIGDEPEGYGNFVQLWHDGLGTVYAHLSQVSVSLNQAVAKGEEVGKCGNTGNAKGTTPHVHVEVRAKGANPRGEPVDPAQYGLA